MSVFWLFVLGAVLMSMDGATAATTAPRAKTTTCTVNNACFPWSTKGPFCGRGANINLRFQLQLTQANFISDPLYADPVSNVTYAFCPRVDELQAFNITRAGELAFTSAANNGTVELVGEQTRYLSLIGAGDLRNVNYPQEGSEGRVVVADQMGIGGLHNMQQCKMNEMAIVEFLVFNMSLENGKFKYYDGHIQPAGTGFVPTCSANDVCLFDSAMICVGDKGQRNCARCADGETARAANIQVWVSYYGTDASGKQLRSGANNPLNFQAYSGGGVARSMQNSYNSFKTGNSQTNMDDLS